MKVVLLQDVAGHGKKGDVVNVSDGYARNVLIAKKWGLEAIPKNLNDLKLRAKNEAKLAAEHLAAAREMAEAMKSWKVETAIKTGENGKVFGSVSSREIADEVKKQYDQDLDKKKIILEEPIRSLGMHEIKVKLHPQVTAILRVHVGEA